MKRPTDKREREKKKRMGGRASPCQKREWKETCIVYMTNISFLLLCEREKELKEKKRMKQRAKKKKKKKRRSEEILWSNPLAEARLDIGIPSNPPPPKLFWCHFFCSPFYPLMLSASFLFIVVNMESTSSLLAFHSHAGVTHAKSFNLIYIPFSLS